MLDMKAFTYHRLGTFGALGNQLWQIASTIGKALNNNGTARFPEWEYGKYFSVPQEYFGPIPEGNETVDLYPDYLQDLSHFVKHADHIIECFSPSKYSAQKIDAM